MTYTVTDFIQPDVLAIEYPCPRCGHKVLSINNLHVGWSSCTRCKATLRLSDEIVKLQMDYMNKKIMKKLGR